MDAELKAYLDAMRQDLMDHTNHLIEETHQHIEGLREDTSRRFDAVDQQINETHVLVEDLRHDLRGVAEGVTTVREQLGRTIADHEERLTRLERRVP
jgi:exonuclease VII large subunit